MTLRMAQSWVLCCKVGKSLKCCRRWRVSVTRPCISGMCTFVSGTLLYVFRINIASQHWRFIVFIDVPTCLQGCLLLTYCLPSRQHITHSYTYKYRHTNTHTHTYTHTHTQTHTRARAYIHTFARTNNNKMWFTNNSRIKKSVCVPNNKLTN